MKSSEDIKKLEQIRICTDIALECCNVHPRKRPFSTQHILDRLEETETTDEVKCYLFIYLLFLLLNNG